MASDPQVTVAVATKDRSDMLVEFLESLRAQTLPLDAFEVIVVDDGSTDSTTAVLDREEQREGLDLSVVRRTTSEGPARARNTAWQMARAPLVAFTDDDCVAAPDWLERLLAACAAAPGTIVQGRTEARADQIHRLSPFSRTQIVRSAGPIFETCNIVYPREMLEAEGGFAADVFPLPGGEDTDLAWRAIGHGARATYAPDAVVEHAVLNVGPAGMVRYARRWEKTVPVFARHPALRRAQLHHGVFWSRRHEELLRFLLAIPVARRSRVAALLLARPYLVYLTARRSGPLLAPYLLAVDLVEMYAIIRGAIRNRVFVV